MSSPDAQARNFVKEYSKLHVSRRLITDLENELQKAPNEVAEYNLVRMDGKYAWKRTVIPQQSYSPQRDSPGKSMRHAPVTPIAVSKRTLSDAKGGMKSGVGCTSGGGWGLAALMGNLEQAAVNMFA